MERSRFVIPNNHSLVQAVALDTEPGKIDFARFVGGEIQMRTRISELPLGRLSLSQDRAWVAIEQHTKASKEGADPRFEVVVRNAMIHKLRATISDCERLLDLSKNGDVVAVVREGAVKLWDTATTKRIKRAPFEHGRIDAAKFSPDSCWQGPTDTPIAVSAKQSEDDLVSLERLT
jgi:hypothetical protein